MKEQRQSSTESLSLFSNLPDDLIPQILLRLPVRSLLRFKSVCKSWLSLISDPQFGKSHFDLAASTTHRCLAKANDSEIESIDVDASLQSHESSVVKLKSTWIMVVIVMICKLGLHWFETKLHFILAFDLVQRTLSEIALSQNLATELESKPYKYYLRVLGECLSLSYPGDEASSAEIWVMKDYKVQSSWTKLFVFSTCNIPRNVIYPICFTKHGDFFCSYGSGRLVILDDKGWLLLDQSTLWPKPHVIFGMDRERILHCGLYRESLLSLPNDLEEACEDDIRLK